MESDVAEAIGAGSGHEVASAQDTQKEGPYTQTSYFEGAKIKSGRNGTSIHQESLGRRRDVQINRTMQ